MNNPLTLEALEEARKELRERARLSFSYQWVPEYFPANSLRYGVSRYDMFSVWRSPYMKPLLHKGRAYRK